MGLPSVLRTRSPPRAGARPPHHTRRWPGLSSKDAAGLAKTMKGGHRPREGPRPPGEVLREPRHGLALPHASPGWAWL